MKPDENTVADLPRKSLQSKVSRDSCSPAFEGEGERKHYSLYINRLAQRSTDEDISHFRKKNQDSSRDT